MSATTRFKALFGVQDMTEGKPIQKLIAFSVPLLIGNFAQIVDLGDRNHRIAAQMRVDDNRLGVGVADDTQALIACKFVELVFKL